MTPRLGAKCASPVGRFVQARPVHSKHSLADCHVVFGGRITNAQFSLGCFLESIKDKTMHKIIFCSKR